MVCRISFLLAHRSTRTELVEPHVRCDPLAPCFLVQNILLCNAQNSSLITILEFHCSDRHC